jgi:hypothetical protein
LSRRLGLARLPKLTSQEITDRCSNGIAPAVIDPSLDQLINVVYELLGKLNGYEPQSNSKAPPSRKGNKGFPSFPVSYLSSKMVGKH